MLLFVVRLCVQSFSSLLLRRLHSSFQTFVFCISSVVFFAPLVGKKKHKRESLFSQNSSNNERTKKLTEEKESEILTERGEAENQRRRERLRSSFTSGK